MLTFDQYVRRSVLAKTQNPKWRWGQTLFNTLYEVCPGLADSIRATEYDPFHRDTIVEKFLVHVEKEWANIEWE